MRVDELAQLIFESVADDERLRGDLDDEAYAPLLEWAANRASRLARGSGEVDTAAATDGLRAAVRALVSAVSSGDAHVLETLDPTSVDRTACDRARAALERAGPLTSDRARALAGALTSEG